LFATQYENDNIAFYRSSGVSGGLALLQGFCQWKIEHQVKKCCVKVISKICLYFERLDLRK